MIKITINKMKKDSEKSAHIIIFKDKDFFLCLKRNKLDPWMPNRWCSVGGHTHIGEDIQKGACREVKEECGLTINPKDLIDTGVIKKEEFISLQQTNTQVMFIQTEKNIQTINGAQ